MTQEEKELLLKDLCGRLPYGVKGIITYNGTKEIFTLKGVFNILFLSDTECCNIEDFKPYLRPMSSMTEEEQDDFFYYVQLYVKRIDGKYPDPFSEISLKIEWLNSHHFDYRGLIEKGLALEAPEGMYRFQQP